MLKYIEQLDIQNCKLSPLPRKAAWMKVIREKLLQIDRHKGKMKLQVMGGMKIMAIT